MPTVLSALQEVRKNVTDKNTAGLSRQRLARLCGVSASAIVSWTWKSGGYYNYPEELGILTNYDILGFDLSADTTRVALLIITFFALVFGCGVFCLF
jgi:hypothetical protein